MPDNDTIAPQSVSRSRLDCELPEIYDELRAVARAYLRGERPGHTLNTISLVHEGYLRLLGLRAIDWADRTHVVAMASRAMRRVLVDHARARGRLKRLPASARPPEYPPAIDPEDLLAIDVALTTLEARLPRHSRIVECRVFAGMTIEETAVTLRLSVATVKRDWAFARAWLNATLATRPGPAAGPRALQRTV